MEQITAYRCSTCGKLHEVPVYAETCEQSHGTVEIEGLQFRPDRAFPETINVKITTPDGKVIHMEYDRA